MAFEHFLLYQIHHCYWFPAALCQKWNECTADELFWLNFMAMMEKLTRKYLSFLNLPFFNPLLLLFVILSVHIERFVVVALFPLFFNVLSIFCVSSLDSFFLHFSVCSIFALFDALLLDFDVTCFRSGSTLLLDNDINLFSPIPSKGNFTGRCWAN